MMKKKQIVPGLVAAALALSCVTPALACTGVYVGSQLTENGSFYMARCEDIGTTHTKILGVSPAADHPADYIYEDTYGFSYPYGGHVYAYSYCKDSPEFEETMVDADGNYIFEAYAEAGQNEKGVSMTATVSTRYNEAAKAADPLVETGICEVSLGTILLGKSATAKEGVDLLAKIIDEKGSGECNSIMICDAKECWYFEIVSGHQYAAVKLPGDKVSIQPNITLLGVIDVEDTENVVASADLVKTAQEGGFLITDESGKIDVAKTYGAKNSGAGQYVRYYQGLFYIDQEAAEALGWNAQEGFEALDNNSPDSPLSLLLDTEMTFSTMDVFKLLATRGEGTQGFNANVDTYADGKAVYAIGNHRQAEVHVFEVRPDMPDQLATIQWQTISPAEFSVFIPYYSALVSEVIPAYDVSSLEYVEDSIYWTFSKLYNLCNSDREHCGVNIQTYFDAYQTSLIQQQEAVDKAMTALYAADPALAAEAATLMGKDLADQVYTVAVQMLAELEAYVEAGDTTQPFMPSAAVENVMPVYTMPAVTRGALISLLYGEAGKPEVASAAEFADVGDAACAKAVAWAAEQGIVKGYASGTFGAEDPVSQEQLVLFLYRYAQTRGMDVTQTGDLSALASQPSSFAQTAVAWALGKGLAEAGIMVPTGEVSFGELAGTLAWFFE